MSVTLLALVTDQIRTTQEEIADNKRDDSYTNDEFRDQTNWNDGWLSGMLYIKNMIDKGTELK